MRRSTATAFLSTLSLRRATTQSQIDARVIPISIHALLAESDPTRSRPTGATWHFYPRSPCGERLVQRGPRPHERGHFYPRSPCGERPTFIVYSITDKCISIHALLAESDRQTQNWTCPQWVFLSTLSLRRATQSRGSVSMPRYHFYPRSPCGERQRNHLFSRRICYFYPRSPCGERQAYQRQKAQNQQISIHALLAESDRY